MDFHVNGRVQALLATQITCLVLVWLTMLIRLGVKLKLNRKPTSDDLWMCLAAAFFTVMGGLIIRGIIIGGFGQNANQLTLGKITIGLQTWYFGEIIYGLMAVCIRVSVTIFLLQFMTHSWGRWLLVASLAVVFVASLCFVLATIFQCAPIDYYWTRFSLANEAGTCSNSQLVRNAAVTHSVVAAISDWLMAFLPITCLWGTRISTASKMVATAIICLGMLAGIAMIVRIPQIKSATLTADFLHASFNLAILSIIEPCLGIVGGSAASLALLIRLSAGRRPGPPDVPITLPRTSFLPTTTTTVRGGRGHSTDFAPPQHGIAVAHRIVHSGEALGDEEMIDYHHVLREGRLQYDSHYRSQHHCRRSSIPTEWR